MGIIKEFAAGMFAGLLVPALLWWLFEDQVAVWGATLHTVDYIERNLGSSVVFFSLDAWVYIRLSLRLHKQLTEAQTDFAAMMHTSQLLDYSVQVFFIIGVVYTAIGMRGALLYALGDSSFNADAAAMLRRLVEGGILLALSTTIAGYIGGVVMKIIKKNTLERRLQSVWEQMQKRREQAREHQLQALLEAVERLPERMAHYQAPVPHERAES